MDNKKDIEKNAEIIKIFDLETSKINPFGDNKVAERAYRRSERISAAIYLLSSHISDQEPLKSRARSHALDLMQGVLSIKDEMRSQHSESAIAFRTSTRQLVSVMRLLAIMGYVSVQNVEAVCGALEELQGFLVSSQRSVLAERISFTKEDLLDVGSYAHRDEEHRSAPVRTVSHSAGVTDKLLAPQFSSIGSQESPVLGAEEAVSLRARSIMDVLRGAGELSIRDVVSHLPEYSEKMIQRELADLVEAGKVHKTGLKRWSRYSVEG